MADPDVVSEGDPLRVLDQLGSPAPLSWRVEQVQGRAQGGDVVWLVKLYVLTPTGMATFFLDGDDAQRLASFLRRAGKACVAGIWGRDLEGAVSSPRADSGDGG